MSEKAAHANIQPRTTCSRRRRLAVPCNAIPMSVTSSSSSEPSGWSESDAPPGRFDQRASQAAVVSARRSSGKGTYPASPKASVTATS